jgi:hypothetical protein
MFSKKSSKVLHVASAGLPKLPDNLPNIPNPFESEEEKKRGTRDICYLSLT